MCGRERTLCVNDPNIDTLECALLERMYYCKVDGQFVEPPTPDRELFQERLSGFKSQLVQRVGSATPVSPEEFSQMYKGRKRTIYTNAVESLYLTGVRRRHAYSNSFVKCEKVNPSKAPRCIQPRTPVYNVGVGRRLKPIEHRLYRAVDKIFGSKTIMKGYDCRQQGSILKRKWDRFRKPVAVGLDATKFDMHVSATALRWEHSIYKYIYRGDKSLARYLSWQVNNVGKGYCADGKLSYSVDGRRFSGDMNTGSGNCIIMCGLVYAYASDRGVPIELANNGDDCQVFMEQGDLDRFMVGLDAWFLEMGFRMTIEEPAYEFERVEFCQMRPIWNGEFYTMVRNIPTAREKDSMTSQDLRSEGMLSKWMYAIGECGLALNSGVPIMQEMYVAYMRHGTKSKLSEHHSMLTGGRYLAQGLEAKQRVVTDEARLSVFLAWDITPDEQVAIEEVYRTMGPLATEIIGLDNIKDSDTTHL